MRVKMKMTICFQYLVVSYFCSVRVQARAENYNKFPIIGIFTEPYFELSPWTEYIAGSYVKFVEAAGARVIPLQYTASKKDLLKELDKVNGVLLPGGAAVLDPGHPFYDAVSTMWDHALETGNFPIFGTCLGFELMCSLASGKKPVLEESGEFDAEDFPQPVNLTENAKDSVLLRGLDQEVYEALQTKNITYNSHLQGITPEIFDGNTNLRSMFTILGYAKDKKGKEFVAMIEGKKYPFYGVQFHPEKANFEWFEPCNIPHQREAIYLSQHLANVFVDQARKNNNAFGVNQSGVATALIENYSRKYLGNSYFSEVFVFQKAHQGSRGRNSIHQEPLKT